jgi:hypothetical protein
MKNENVASLAPSLERRRFGRINVAQPGICHINLPPSEELWSDRCILMNISLGGIYFICQRQPPLEKNDIYDLTFDMVYPHLPTYHLTFYALVVRTEPRQLNRHYFGLALKLLSEPFYYPFRETNRAEFLPLDKPRIMYQYYHLNLKAHEIITKTPEIRTAKTGKIKACLDQGSYKVQTEKVTQSLINGLFLENALLLPK